MHAKQKLQKPTLIVVFFCQDLKDYMRQAGEVTYADAHKQRRNEGYVSEQLIYYFNFLR